MPKSLTTERHNTDKLEGSHVLLDKAVQFHEFSQRCQYTRVFFPGSNCHSNGLWNPPPGQWAQKDVPVDKELLSIGCGFARMVRENNHDKVGRTFGDR